MTKISNVRNITKFKRSIKAISPVIATLLMIAIAVVASLVVYAWVSGYMGFQTEKAGKAVAIPSFAIDANGNMVVYVQNVGQGDVEVSSVYINDELVLSTSTDVLQGKTEQLSITQGAPYESTERYNIKVTTTDGTSMTATGKPGAGGSVPNPTSNPTATPTAAPTQPPVTQYIVTVTEGTNGNIEPNTASHVAGATPTFTITPDSGYRISSISVNGNPVTVTTPSGQSYQFAALSAAGSITATYEVIPPTQYTITVTDTANGDISPNTGSYAAGQSFTITPSSGYRIASITVNGNPVTVTASSGQTYQFTVLSAAASITATYAANTPVTITLRPNAAGSTTQLNAQGSGSANWDRVDEVTSDTTTTYVRGTSDDTWQVDTYNIQNQALSGTITNVRIYINARESEYRPDDTYGRTAVAIGSGSIQYGTQLALTTSWANYYTDYATKTGSLGTGAWTWTDINNLQIGVGLQSHQSFNAWRYAQCTQVWVEITYIPA